MVPLYPVHPLARLFLLSLFIHVHPATFAAPYPLRPSVLSRSSSVTLEFFRRCLVVVVDGGSARIRPTKSSRVIYLIFEIRAILFSSPALYTLRWLASQAPARGSWHSRVSLRPSHEIGRDTGMSASLGGQGLERRKEGQGYSTGWVQDHEVEGLAPRGLRYSPDIERSKPSHHWNYQSLPLLPFPTYSAAPAPRHPSFLLSFPSPRSRLPRTASLRNFLRGELYYIAIVLLRRSVWILPFLSCSLFFFYPPKLDFLALQHFVVISFTTILRWYRRDFGEFGFYRRFVTIFPLDTPSSEISLKDSP